MWEIEFYRIIADLFCSSLMCDHSDHSDEVVVVFDRKAGKFFVKEEGNKTT